MKKAKFGEKIGSYFLLPSTLELMRIVDSPWKTYIILINMSRAKYQDRYRKTQTIPAYWRELSVKVTEV